MITVEKELFEIDTKLDELVRQIELLDYVNPINIAEEKKRFFDSKYTIEPNFKYPKFQFNAFELHRSFFDQKVEQIQDKKIQSLYTDIVYTYLSLISCIDNIGNGKKFYYNSLRAFGTPTEIDVENAKFILHFEDEDLTSDMLPTYSALDAENYFRTFAQQYNFDFKIEHSEKLSAIAMVLNNIKTLVINKNHTFSKNELQVLANHEIGVHMVTTFNGAKQQLKIFSHGFPNNVETQEGLAVYSEFMSNNLTLKRLKELAYRVIAVDSLAKGYTFTKTFSLLTNTYHLNKNDAFNITLRVHRGGGFTKDYLYLTGLKKIFEYHKKGNDLSPLLTGKVSLEYVDTINYLKDKSLAVAITHQNIAFAENKNTNKLVAFILNNLK
ncbi:flavohemoglobin expression-modulating QEGLA motif protein [Lutibacter sp.]